MTMMVNNGMTRKVQALAIRGMPLDIILQVLGQEAELTSESRETIAIEYDKVNQLLLDRESEQSVAKEKALWMMSVYRTLAKQRGRQREIDVMDGPFDARRFFDDYYFANKPVRVRGFSAQWQSFDQWKIPALASAFGDAEIEVTSHRDCRADYDEKFQATLEKMPFSRFVAMLESSRGEVTNDFYLTARNLALRGVFKSLVSSLKQLPEVLSEHRSDYLNLWIGPHGTTTKLHHDLTNVLFLQLAGTKRLLFLPPYETELIRLKSGLISDVNLEEPDLSRYPGLGDATILATVVEEGDALLIPVGWWHQVHSLSESVSLTFINFKEYNFFPMGSYGHMRENR